MNKKEQEFWNRLFSLAPVNRSKPFSTLYAVIRGGADLELAQQFAAGGNKLDQRFMGGDAVSMAVHYGSLDFVKYFVENAVDIQSKSDILTSAITRISESGPDKISDSLSVLDYLLEKNFSQLMLASAYQNCATRSQYTAAKKLIQAGLKDAEIYIDQDEKMLLSESTLTCGEPAFAMLLAGGDIDESDLLAKEAQVRLKGERHRDYLDNYSIDSGCEVLEGRDFDAAYAALVNEIEQGEWSSVLLSEEPHWHRTVLEFAAENGFESMVEALLKTDVLPQKGKTKLMIRAAELAAAHGEMATLQIIARHGGDVAYTGKHKNSPLSQACSYGQLEIVEYLLEQGADPNSADASGHTRKLDQVAGGAARKQIIEALKRKRRANVKKK